MTFPKKLLVGGTAALLLVVVLAAAPALAKLPAPSDEAKAKAAEAAAKTAHGNKVADFQLCKSRDKVAVAYIANAQKAGKDIKPTETPPCADPGPFVYAPPAAASAPTAGPLETAGAHSPPKTAATPPNTAVPAAVQDPAKK